MRHICLVERLGHLLVEVLIEDMNHRSLPQCSQRLVCRLGGIHPHPSPCRVGNEATVQKSIVASYIGGVGSQIVLEAAHAFTVLQPFSQRPC